MIIHDRLYVSIGAWAPRDRAVDAKSAGAVPELPCSHRDGPVGNPYYEEPRDDHRNSCVQYRFGDQTPSSHHLVCGWGAGGLRFPHPGSRPEEREEDRII